MHVLLPPRSINYLLDLLERQQSYTLGRHGTALEGKVHAWKQRYTLGRNGTTPRKNGKSLEGMVHP